MKEEPQNPDEDLKTAQYVIDKSLAHATAVQVQKVGETTTSESLTILLLGSLNYP